MYAIVESISKIVAMGGDYHSVRLSFQEFFEKLLNDPKKWGKPFAALLGAYHTQGALSLPAIGGKDSMSGSFEDLDVPPTLVSFAITTAEVENVISPELKEDGHVLAEIQMVKDNHYMFDFKQVKEQYNAIIELIKDKKVYSAYTIKDGGVLEAVSKMAFGNEIGVSLDMHNTLASLVQKDFGNIVIEVKSEKDLQTFNQYRILGTTNTSEQISYGADFITLYDLYACHTKPLEAIYPTSEKAPTSDIKIATCYETGDNQAKVFVETPTVVIPVFPGTNCEYDSKRAFEKAGAKVELVLIRNKSEAMLAESITALEEAIYCANIVMLPGGFSAGDEPEGSGKFIATVLRNPKLKAAITDLLEQRDGLMIGICNGFQALVKLGLLPYGNIKEMTSEDPTLTFNTIGRHVSQMVDTRIGSVKSPWLANVQVGDIHTIPVSHGEGRFVAPKEVLAKLFENGQVFSQYVDRDGKVTMVSPSNPNGSMYAIEGIVSENGRILGKMGHSERQGLHRLKNIYGMMDQQLFEAGVNYFKKK
jgi:phosphoribosylformylglycinamidine synthase